MCRVIHLKYQINYFVAVACFMREFDVKRFPLQASLCAFEVYQAANHYRHLQNRILFQSQGCRYQRLHNSNILFFALI